MSRKDKPVTESDEPQEMQSAPVVDPPGRVRTEEERMAIGPSKSEPELRGSARLRAALKLSSNVPIEQLCDDAAWEIEKLRGRHKPRSIFA